MSPPRDVAAMTAVPCRCHNGHRWMESLATWFDGKVARCPTCRGVDADEVTVRINFGDVAFEMSWRRFTRWRRESLAMTREGVPGALDKMVRLAGELGEEVD